MPILEIRSTNSDQSLTYIVEGSGQVAKYDDPNDDTLAAGKNDNIYRFDDGTYLIVGHTNNQYGDAYDMTQEPDAFTKFNGQSDYTITYNGNDITNSLSSVDQERTLPDFIDRTELEKWYITRHPQVAAGALYADAGSTGGGGGGTDEPSEPEPEPEPQGKYLDGSLEIASTSRTPAMRYTIHVDGSVSTTSSLESADNVTPGSPTVIEGTVGPSGADTYVIDGYVTNWEAVNVDSGNSVDESRYDVLYDGDEIGVWELLGNPEPEYLDDSAAALGGGQYYSAKFTEDDADYVVDTLSEARDVLGNRASSGDIVFVPGNVEIYSSSKSRRLHVPSGVTFCSDRGVEGSDGALIHTDAAYSNGADGLVTVSTDGRVNGIRVRGPHPNVEWRDHSYSYEMAGIEATGSRAEIDNCEVWGWAVCTNQSAPDVHIHHNHLHHANMKGLGYGVLTSGYEGAVIEYNHFEHWRHAVAAGGSGGFEARHNLCDGPALAHCFDQHSPGGTYTYVHHNTMTVVSPASGDPRVPMMTFRGSNVRNGEVHHNWSYNEWESRDPSEGGAGCTGGFTDEWLTHAKDGGTCFQGIEHWDNHLGTSEPPSEDIGCPR